MNKRESRNKRKRDKHEESDTSSESSESDSESESESEGEKKIDADRKSHSTAKRERKPMRTKGIVNGKTRLLVYVLESMAEKKVRGRESVYIGYTFQNQDDKNDRGVWDRLDEHNGIKSGGANKTVRGRPHRLVATLSGDPSWFHRRHALYVEKCLQTLVQKAYRKEQKWRAEKSSISKVWQRRFKAFPPPPILPALQRKRMHAQASNRIQQLLWFLHAFAVWPIRSERKSPSKSKKQRRRKRGPSAPLDIRKGSDHSVQIKIHSDFITADTIRQLESSIRYWNPTIVSFDDEPSYNLVSDPSS